jgi:hypothetical protein
MTARFDTSLSAPIACTRRAIAPALSRRCVSVGAPRSAHVPTSQGRPSRVCVRVRDMRDVQGCAHVARARTPTTLFPWDIRTLGQ